MPNITVKNIPDHTYETLKQLATSNHRSVNSEIIYLIERATTSKPFNPEQHLSLAKQMREKTKKFVLTENVINLTKAEGRP
ncbi:MAG: Arc family DNA-binding protein [Desulfofustis sp. PB-SRB1]|jgi:plasmid stability protein|nr:Arc family DNA-binding protein [Desulfofustis sp. PB-SRB1]MBL0380992.1 Arc family DNA-binding protein [Desulfofustis sp. PB-SRB1]MBM1002515.1 Arc family DNA-binding protein [Desulfofustis sp. PB-SRB1]